MVFRGCRYVLRGRRVSGLREDNYGGLYIRYTDSSEVSLLYLVGDKGDRGESFVVDHVGDYSDRVMYDASVSGTSFLALDRGELYFRQGVSGWSSGIPFERGDPGVKGRVGDAG